MKGTLLAHQGREDDALADARFWRVDLSEEELYGATQAVWAENADAVIAFLKVQTQWRVCALVNGKVIRTGLDYQGVQAGLQAAGIQLTPALWADFQMIEMGAMAETNES